MVRVVFRCQRGGAGNGPVWWAAFPTTALTVIGKGSGQKPAIRREAQPQWGPKPDGKRTHISRAKGTRVDGEAFWDLPEGTLLRCGATCAGGRRNATLKSPVLVVVEGAHWKGRAVDGTRWVQIEIEGARPITLEEALTSIQNYPCQGGKNEEV